MNLRISEPTFKTMQESYDFMLRAARRQPKQIVYFLRIAPEERATVLIDMLNAANGAYMFKRGLSGYEYKLRDQVPA